MSYSRNAVTIPITVPYTEDFTPFPLGNRTVVDRHVIKGWNRMRLTSATSSVDHVFMRRVYLHLIGRPPTSSESLSFIDSRNGEKRGRLIDSLLENPEHAKHWASLWRDWLNVDFDQFTKTENTAFDVWLAESLTGKRSLHVAVTQMLTATGSMKDTPAAAFALAHKDAATLAETTSRVFLGTESRCFRCHDHPLGGRRLDDYDAFKACFVGLRRTKTDDTRHLVWSETRLRHPDSGLPIIPAALGETLKIEKGRDPRFALSKWIVSPKNPQFAKSVVDRYWKQLFGSSLPFEADGFRSIAVAAQSELLNVLAEEFVQHDYDPRHLLRVLCNSDVYQLSLDPMKHYEAAPAFFHRRIAQRISSREMIRMIERMTETSAAENGLKDFNLGQPGGWVFQPLRPRRPASRCDLTGNEAYLGAALHLLNSAWMQKMVTHKKGRAARLAASKLSNSAITDELYMASYSRRSTEAERKVVLAHLESETKKSGNRRQGVEDVVWAILNSKEFLFNG